MLKFLFGEGWWMAWYAVVWLGSLMFVGIPVFALIRDAVPKPAGPASLGTVVFAMGIGVFLGAVTLIDAVVAARLGGLGWIVSLVIALAAGAGVTVGGYLAAAVVGDKGGYAWSGVLTAVCIAIFTANLGALAYAREAVARPAGQAAGAG